MGELPERWDAAAEKVDVRQTYRGIGDASGLSHVTMRRLIAQGSTSPAAICKVADALALEESTFCQWAGVPVSDWGPWVPPREAHKLSPRARKALEDVIRAIAGDGGQQDGWQPEAEKTGTATVTPDDSQEPGIDVAWPSALASPLTWVATP